MGTVSSALGLVAAAVPDGARVPTRQGEFTSTTFPFAAQVHRGVTSPNCLQSTIGCGGDFDAVAASLVQSANGAVLDMETLRPWQSRYLDGDRCDTSAGLEQLDLGWADVTVAGVYNGCWRRAASHGYR